MKGIVIEMKGNKVIKTYKCKVDVNLNTGEYYFYGKWYGTITNEELGTWEDVSHLSCKADKVMFCLR